MQVSSAPLRCLEGQKLPLSVELTAALKVSLLTETLIVAEQPRCSCQRAKMYQCKCGKVCASVMTACTETGRYDHIVFAILNENTDIFRESQGPTAFFSTKLYDI